MLSCAYAHCIHMYAFIYLYNFFGILICIIFKSFPVFVLILFPFLFCLHMFCYYDYCNKLVEYFKKWVYLCISFICVLLLLLSVSMCVDVYFFFSICFVFLFYPPVIYCYYFFDYE
ncbi:hypothetical protein KP509_32G039400 [Ceratopteris richardii]|uniref:Uncharacterized protein n=1 Tax=Ceratopteris richardii TaxID=49495 RepID=A0A8T2QU98_CERRI|nr:hypothetical protein KP509_32G039400 [Ceratopteris richardii]